jgi:hypothetical protein
LEYQPNQGVAAIVRFPPPPDERDRPSFTWDAGDYILDDSAVNVYVPITFTPWAPGAVTYTLELISNAEGSPYQVLLRGTGRKGIVP